ncbi:unnamed protein product, partial [Rotaria sordida]
YEYEKIQDENGFLEEFFQSSVSKVKTDIVKKWLEQLIQCRSSTKQFQLPSDSNLNTMLKYILYDNQGTYLYKLPVSDIREKVNDFISSSKSQNDNSSSIDTIEHLTNLVKDVEDQYD